MLNSDIGRVIAILKKEAGRFKTPYVTDISKTAKDPFKVLVSCILSLRTKDDTTAEASVRLFKKADTPEKLQSLPIKQIEKAIYPVGFYRKKARTIKGLAAAIVGSYSSNIPDAIEELLKFKGVGRKTANLVVTMGYGKPGICVDTHVHRIVNRWGYVRAKNPLKTEFALRKKLPERYWIIFNSLLVAFGQNICVPVSPHCSMCRLYGYCKRKGVGRHR